jgi:ankyrin repeat protein
MHRALLLIGMGTALVSAACRPKPVDGLSRAAAENDIAGIRRLLAAGHPPDEPASPDVTPLMWAARFGALDAMTALLDAGADLSARGGANRWTPLQHAIHTGRTAAVRLLLDRGADPNAAEHPGALTPLLMGVLEPDPAIVELLLAHGADPRLEGECGDTPLTRAVSGGALADIDKPLAGSCRVEIVRALLAHDPTLRLPETFTGRAAIWWARLHRCDEVLELVNGQRTQSTQWSQSESP